MPRDLVKAKTGDESRGVGRPQKVQPAEAEELVEELASDGWSIVGIAWKLGVTAPTLKRWLDEYPALLEAFEVGRERERQTLHNTAFRMAAECAEPAVKLRAIMYLLNTRHNYAEPNPEARLTFNAPVLVLQAPMSAEEYRKAIEQPAKTVSEEP